MMSWISPRIWRSAESRFNEDEPMNCAEVYSSGVLQSIYDQGFDSVWMRGRLWDLIHSEIFPELNDNKANKRISNLQQVIADGKEKGIKVFLYFNEPLGLPENHEFWKKYPQLAGEPHGNMLAFCTSTAQFREFFGESVGNLFDDLAGLGGVILITASEYHSHCWSHKARNKIGDIYIDKCLTPMKCPNCKDREPADVVAELINLWKTNADHQPQPPEVWVWNWSWSMWYDNPQQEVIEKLPADVKLMCDFERGGTRRQKIGNVFIDEYSLGYVGPSERFLGAKQAADEKNISTCGKLQIGTTHELATVPNLPLIPNLFDKLKNADKLGLKGLMFSWNFGNTPSLNTAAIKLFVEQEYLQSDKKKFLSALTKRYFGNVDSDKILKAWKLFCESFAQYPFSIPMLYTGPMNYSVAYPLRLKYEDRPMGPSWIWHEHFGDRLDDCINPFTLDKVCRCFGLMESCWSEGLHLYKEALNQSENENQIKELSCAEMVGCHISASKNIFDFHLWRQESMKEQNLEGPCELTSENRSDEIISRHIQTCKTALKLAKDNSQFGYHQEPHVYFYDAKAIATCIAKMETTSCH